jgi:hypothetical protein
MNVEKERVVVMSWTEDLDWKKAVFYSPRFEWRLFVNFNARRSAHCRTRGEFGCDNHSSLRQAKEI